MSTNYSIFGHKTACDGALHQQITSIKHENMRPEVISTGDNSHTIYLPDIDETYHSRNGAVNEANHVYIQHGLAFMATRRDNLRLFEMGFGTGLNALLARHYAESTGIALQYDVIEKYPLEASVYNELNYDKELQLPVALRELHACPWETIIPLSTHFSLRKWQADLAEHVLSDNYYDVVFFDAFGPAKQPEVWKLEILEKIHNSMTSGAALVTYCSQGQFRRDLKQTGFEIENLPGPKGKREMTRAFKK